MHKVYTDTESYQNAFNRVLKLKVDKQNVHDHTHTDLPLLLRTRQMMSRMRRMMIMISSKQPITIPATSPPFRHVAETERMVSKGEN